MTVEKQLEELKLKTAQGDTHENDSKNSEEENVSPFLSSQPKTKSSESAIKAATNNEIFCGYSILYRFIPEKKELKERGVGDLIIELVSENNLYRVRMIRKQIESYACNHYVEPHACLTKHEVNKNTYIWTTTTDVCDPLAVESKEDEVIEVTDGQDWKKDAKKSPKQTFICRFKTEEVSKKFEEMFEVALVHNEKVLFGTEGVSEEKESPSPDVKEKNTDDPDNFEKKPKEDENRLNREEENTVEVKSNESKDKNTEEANEENKKEEKTVE